MARSIKNGFSSISVSARLHSVAKTSLREIRSVRGSQPAGDHSSATGVA